MSYAWSTFERRGRTVSALRSVSTGQFASVDEARTTIFMWHSMGDACPECANLNGKEWRDQDIFNETLWDPFWGDLCNLTTGQKFTHGGTGINCRCDLEVRVEIDIAAIDDVVELQATLKMM